MPVRQPDRAVDDIDFHPEHAVPADQPQGAPVFLELVSITRIGKVTKSALNSPQPDIRHKLGMDRIRRPPQFRAVPDFPLPLRNRAAGIAPDGVGHGMEQRNFRVFQRYYQRHLFNNFAVHPIQPDIRPEETVVFKFHLGIDRNSAIRARRRLRQGFAAFGSRRETGERTAQSLRFTIHANFPIHRFRQHFNAIGRQGIPYALCVDPVAAQQQIHPVRLRLDRSERRQDDPIHTQAIVFPRVDCTGHAEQIFETVRLAVLVGDRHRQRMLPGARRDRDHSPVMVFMARDRDGFAAERSGDPGRPEAVFDIDPQRRLVIGGIVPADTVSGIVHFKGSGGRMIPGENLPLRTDQAPAQHFAALRIDQRHAQFTDIWIGGVEVQLQGTVFPRENFHGPQFFGFNLHLCLTVNFGPGELSQHGRQNQGASCRIVGVQFDLPLSFLRRAQAVHPESRSLFGPDHRQHPFGVKMIPGRNNGGGADAVAPVTGDVHFEMISRRPDFRERDFHFQVPPAAFGPGPDFHAADIPGEVGVIRRVTVLPVEYGAIVVDDDMVCRILVFLLWMENQFHRIVAVNAPVAFSRVGKQAAARVIVRRRGPDADIQVFRVGHQVDEAALFRQQSLAVTDETGQFCASPPFVFIDAPVDDGSFGRSNDRQFDSGVAVPGFRQYLFGVFDRNPGGNRAGNGQGECKNKPFIH